MNKLWLFLVEKDNAPWAIVNFLIRLKKSLTICLKILAKQSAKSRYTVYMEKEIEVAKHKR